MFSQANEMAIALYSVQRRREQPLNWRPSSVAIKRIIIKASPTTTVHLITTTTTTPTTPQRKRQTSKSTQTAGQSSE